MITFRQFINEAERRDLVQYLKEHCKPACTDISKANKVFYRRIKAKSGYDEFTADSIKKHVYKHAPPDDEPAVIVGSVLQTRADRKPLDTPEWAHDVFNDFFEEKYGVRLRSKSVFAYLDEDWVAGYGRAHVIIPIGEYEVIWSRKGKELTTDLFPDGGEGKKAGTGRVGGDGFWTKKGVSLANVTREMQVQEIYRRLKEYDFQTGNNATALKEAAGEIMIMCSSYMAFPVNQGYGQTYHIIKDLLQLCKEAAHS